MPQEPLQGISAPMAADHRAAMQFDGPETFQLDLPVAEFSVDSENRIIEGLTLPYGQVGTKGGVKFRFDRGALQWSDVPRVKLMFPRHGDAIGKAIQLDDTPSGLLARFKVGRGAEGDRALELAEDGVYDGFSVGIDFDAARDAVPDPKDRGVMLVRRADLRHVALTDVPVFDDARVTRVAASRTQGESMSDTTTAEAEVQPEPAAVPVTAQFDVATVGQLLAALAPGATPAAPQAPEEGRQVVDPTRALNLSVSEPAPYTFDRDGNLRPGSHDFSTDLIAGVRDHDQAAYDRALSFVQAQFDVVSSNVSTLNPNVQRPDMYVDQREFRYPVWDAVNKGTLSDKTPFVFPKFNTASGLVGAHVEGTEPTSGAFTATSQTVTPTAISGKAKISREVFDAGGSPQVSGLIWRQMVRGWFEALEAAAVAELDAASPTSLGTFAVGGGTNKQTLVAELESYLSALQFVRGGFSMTDLFCQIDLYLALVAAKDTTLRPYFPVIGPMNTRGTTTARFGLIDINGVTGIPTWALAATGIVPASSYLFDRESVHGWASAPQRIDITMTEVANVYLGIWGYKATAISDINGVREVIYDPA
jgi:HK97 family phage prohead protease